MKTVMQHLPILIPLVVIQLTLMVTALIHVLRHPHYRFGSKLFWILIVALLNIIGPVVYFAAGKGENR